MIEVKNIVKRFGDKPVLMDVGFTAGDNEIVGFLGPNGAGKTTTLNIITGYLSATSGTVTVDGFDILDDPISARRQIGFLPEIPPLYPDMTVEEYLNFIYELRKCTFNRAKHLEEITEVTRISDVYKRVIGNLSKGYKQRVGIAQALVANPKTIILDEPTAGLDPQQIIEIRNLVRVLGREHTVIFSSHVLSEVQAVADRIVIINKGRIVADERADEITRVAEGKRRFSFTVCGPEKEVFAALRGVEGVSYVESLPSADVDSTTYIVESAAGADVRRGVFALTAARNWPLIGVEAIGVNLEEIFISLVDRNQKTTSRRGASAGANERM
ncbi:MAG: ATP-binding cassette domain-containing protein [Clostridiales bacterium]|jgi:ABC-2 type transport system ATP-binding protein|nr:ATP-binding cassette domain-containing protein [Clostridiales bacterium]